MVMQMSMARYTQMGFDLNRAIERSSTLWVCTPSSFLSSLKKFGDVWGSVVVFLNMAYVFVFYCFPSRYKHAMGVVLGPYPQVV